MAVESPPVVALEGPETQRYLDDAVRVWLGLSRAAAAEAPRLPERLARRLLRLEEHESSRRDRWGLWNHTYSEDAAVLRVPEIDRWLAGRRAELAASVPLEPLWPDRKQFAVCITHDVDLVGSGLTPRQLVRYARAGVALIGAETDSRAVRLARAPARFARSLPRVSRAPSTRQTLELSVALESERDLAASYFFTVPTRRVRSRWDCVYAPDDACTFRGRRRRIADVMRDLAAEGFDVGLHGSYQAGDGRVSLEEERETLQRATGLEITTTRQHFLHWDVRWTPQLQEAAGLSADSSLGFNRDVGFRAGTSLPFRWFDAARGRALDMVEVPLVVQDGALLGEIGLGVGAQAARDLVAGLFDGAAEVGSAITLVFHPDKLSRTEWLQLYAWTLDEAVARDAWVTSLAVLDAWWRERERRVLGSG